MTFQTIGFAASLALIRAIDKQIDAVRRELRRRETIDRTSAASWQRAWDRHPELRAREVELFRQRGAAQQIRDAAAHKDLLHVKHQQRATARA